MSDTILIFTAHPDDESFPIGGTIARYAANGARVVLVCATRGEAGIEGLGPVDTARIRERELRNAAQILGVQRLEFLGYLDGQLDQVPLEEGASKVLIFIQEEQPQAVITFGPDGISGHPDHLAVHRWIKAAFDRTHSSARLFYIRPSESTRQGCGVKPPEEIASGPVAIIDISAYMEVKVRAMQAHASQEPPYPGELKDEAGKLACQESFTLALPAVIHSEMSDFFTRK